MMGIALGGIGVLSLKVPYTLSYSFIQLLDLPSILLATFFVVVFGLIAYFTNPTEASFRAFLTELAFRKHLSRLSEAQDVDPDMDDDDTRSHNSHRTPDHKNSLKDGIINGHTPASPSDAPVVFHFANKAIVSFRTPGYQFRSFGVLTFAIVSPVEMAMAPAPVLNPGNAHGQSSKSLSWSDPSTRGAWFIGAFGRWWLGVEMNMEPRQVKLAVQDDAAPRVKESVRSRGEMGEASSATRQVEEPSPSPKATKPAIPRRTSTAGSPRTKATLRERLSLQTGSTHKREAHTHLQTPPRPTTPPPLPKSASLPLHTKRVPPSSSEARRVKGENGVHHGPPLLPAIALPDTNLQIRAHTPSIHDHSPVIADILKQLDATRNATSDLHTQLAEFRSASARTHASLQTEVDTARATKKREDAGRAEIKARTKSLDDARRQADGNKREAEKKLRTAAAARDGATGRIERLGREIEEMRRQMTERSERAVETQAQMETERKEISEALAAKREEIKEVEEVVSTLSAEARDLESKIAEEIERLQKMKENAKTHGRQRTAVSTSQADASFWPPPLSNPSRASPRGQLSRHQLVPTPGTDAEQQPTDIRRAPSSPRPHPPPLNLSTGVSHMNSNSNVTAGEGQHILSQFRPFTDSPVSPSTTPAYAGPLSPVSASLIPNSLIHSLENPRSAVPIGDPLFRHVPVTRSLTSDALHSPTDEPLPSSQTTRFDSQRAIMPPRPRSPVHEDEGVASKARHWFSTATAKEKGLNPDAKVFTLSNRRPFALGASNSGSSTPSTFGSDAFYPNPAKESPPPRFNAAGLFVSSLHSAFAPLPAEREALQRALGPGSKNTSLEHVSGHGNVNGGGGVAGVAGGGSSGSHHSSSHWVNEPRRDLSVSAQKSSFNPWAGMEGKEE